MSTRRSLASHAQPCPAVNVSGRHLAQPPRDLNRYHNIDLNPPKIADCSTTNQIVSNGYGSRSRLSRIPELVVSTLQRGRTTQLPPHCEIDAAGRPAASPCHEACHAARSRPGK